MITDVESPTAGPGVRLVVIGNSGAGKSTFAARVGADLHVPIFDLDVLSRHPDGTQRAVGEARGLVTAAARTSGWVIEGVFQTLIETALDYATLLVWLDLSWDECKQGLLQRGPHYGMDPRDADALRDWAGAHWERHAGQAQLYAEFSGPKVRLRSRSEVTGCSAGQIVAMSAP